MVRTESAGPVGKRSTQIGDRDGSALGTEHAERRQKANQPA
jgi:hypothetical protein